MSYKESAIFFANLAYIPRIMVGDYGVMTSEPVVGVVLGRPVVGKMTLIYIC